MRKSADLADSRLNLRAAIVSHTPRHPKVLADGNKEVFRGNGQGPNGRKETPRISKPSHGPGKYC
jgi:hypothetical protein